MPKYDALNGGLEQLAKDLQDYANYLTYANNEIVNELAKVGEQYIIENSGIAKEVEQQIDLSTKTHAQPKSFGKYVSKSKIVNDSNKAAFSEFGYGIIGASSPYSHNDFLNMYSAGYIGYDIDSPAKRPDRSWWYTDAFGIKHNTMGALPTNLFYRAGQKIKQNFPSVAQRILSRWNKW